MESYFKWDIRYKCMNIYSKRGQFDLLALFPNACLKDVYTQVCNSGWMP
jgi:hypothetical protein